MDRIVREILSHHDKKDGVLPVLEEVQATLSHIPKEAIAKIADSLNISTTQIYEVASFYSFLSVEPSGENVIRVCGSIPCFLKNSDVVVKTVEKELGIGVGETTSDGKFSLQMTNCIGACDKAPAMMINKKVYGNLTPEKVAEILKDYR